MAQVRTAFHSPLGFFSFLMHPKTGSCVFCMQRGVAEIGDDDGFRFVGTAAEKITAELMPDIVKFHQLSMGGIEAIGLLFSESKNCLCLATG